MSNAAIYLNPEAFDTTTNALMGRHSAGESFLRGYLRHAEVDQFYFWNVANRPIADLQAFVNRIEPVSKPSVWIRYNDRVALGQAGVLNLPVPGVGAEAWARRPAGDAAYGICGLTHTTATDRVMDAIGELLIAPVKPWDALICTSSAVRAAVDRQLEATTDYLAHRFGGANVPKPRVETIPLGINVADFITTGEQKKAWRDRLNIDDDTVVALYVGRFNPAAKMNPLPMALALERAAALTDKKIAWVVAGWSDSDEMTESYHSGSRACCPSVQYIALDGRLPDVRFSVWAVGDFFLSLSDNIQETFGLTPVEAMAAGMPNIVSDWDGYRDTIRHGVDGFRIPSCAPRPGTGGDLAYRYANKWLSYGHYVGAVSQMTAIDVNEAARAIVALVDNQALRASMGAAARERAVIEFDWINVIKRYQALWLELNQRRLAEKEATGRPTGLIHNPWRMDPFSLFASYPTECLTSSTMLSLNPGANWDAVKVFIQSKMARSGVFGLPTEQELEGLLLALSKVRTISVADIVAEAPAGRRVFLERGILYFAKYGFVTIAGRSGHLNF